MIVCRHILIMIFKDKMDIYKVVRHYFVVYHEKFNHYNIGIIYTTYISREIIPFLEYFYVSKLSYLLKFIPLLEKGNENSTFYCFAKVTVGIEFQSPKIPF